MKIRQRSCGGRRSWQGNLLRLRRSRHLERRKPELEWLNLRKRVVLTTKDTKEHEGVVRNPPSCTFVAFAVYEMINTIGACPTSSLHCYTKATLRYLCFPPSPSVLKRNI